ncbi:hypothetical protein D3C76_1215600 [compost metagenome]
MVEEELQAAVEHRALGQVVVVQHQQQGRFRRHAEREFVEQVVEPGLVGERLVPLAHLQQAHGVFAEAGEIQAQAVQQAFEEAPRIAVAGAQPQPQAAPLRIELLAELDGQRTLAEPRRRRDQHQAAGQTGAHALAEPRTGDMAVGQRWTEEAAGGSGQYWQSREFGHAALAHSGSWTVPAARQPSCLSGLFEDRFVTVRDQWRLYRGKVCASGEAS